MKKILILGLSLILVSLPGLDGISIQAQENSQRCGQGKATIQNLWEGRAHFEVDQDSVPVQGGPGHREAFAVNRPDISPTTAYLYHRIFDRGAPNPTIGLSISNDGGQTFEYSGEVVGPDPDHIFSVAPSVIKKDDKWYMVYEESNVASVYWAESIDGVTWTKKGLLIHKGTEGSWDSGATATPGIFLDDDGKIYVFYAGFREGDVHMDIGYASGYSMDSLRKYYGNPVFRNSDSGWDKGQVSMPRIIKEGNHYYMVYEGADTDFTCNKYNKYGFGFARSTDLKNWERYSGNPIRQSLQITYGCGNDMPSIFVRYDGQIFVYHTSGDTRNIVREKLVLDCEAPSFSLSPGWNQITWPDVSGKKASDTPLECPIAVTKEAFWFKPYVKNFGGKNFNFEKGKTYYLKCNQETIWQL